MYRSSPPTLGTGTVPLRISGAARRVLDEPADSARDPAYRTYLTDMVRPFGLAVHTEALGEGRGQSYGDMADALIAEVTAEDQLTDLLVMAYAVPDVTPWRCTAAHLSHMCPGNPMAFAVSDCGTTAAFTGLRQRALDAIAAVLPRVVDSDALVITPEMKLMSDLGMRSASMLELLLELEDNLDIQIDVEDIDAAAMTSVGDLADYVAGHAITNT